LPRQQNTKKIILKTNGLKLKKQYKEKLATAVKTSWPQIKKINKKSDLYIYFYYQGLSLLNKGGLLCFINLNSWLDVGYGIRFTGIFVEIYETHFTSLITLLNVHSNKPM
jgi:hypothetical protein